VDKEGSYVQGLKPSDFELYDNGAPQTIQVDESFAPVSVVVAIQADAKVEAVLPKIKKIGSVLNNLLAGDQGEVAVVCFDHRIQKLQDFTNDTQKVEDALAKIKPGSSSSRLIDAIEESTRMLTSRPKERRRIILLISESRDKGSSAKVRETLTQSEIGNVMIYALNMSRLFTELTAKPGYPRPDAIPAEARHMPAGGAATPTTAAQMTGSPGYGANFVPLITEMFRGVKAVFIDNPVEVFTKYSGGREIPFVTQAALERAVSEVGREIHNQYIISYNPNNKVEGGFHTIQVVVKRNGLEPPRTRPGYWLATVQ
jgi:VWFA-related protein